MSPRLAVATEDFAPSLKKAIGQAALCEVEGVRLNSRTEISAAEVSESSLRQTLLYVRERQMKVAGLFCPTRHALYDSDYLEPRIDIIRKSMGIARKLETDIVLIRCGRIPDPDADTSAVQVMKVDVDDDPNPFSFASAAAKMQPTPSAEFSLLCEVLNDLTDYGNHVGCVLNVLLTSYDLRLAKRLLAEVKAGPLNIAFDPATAVMTATDVTGSFRDLYQQVGYVRARDALRNIDDAGTEVGVGDGLVAWDEFLPTLAEADYTGWLCVERTGGDHRSEDVQRGVNYLKTLLPQDT